MHRGHHRAAVAGTDGHGAGVRHTEQRLVTGMMPISRDVVRATTRVASPDQTDAGRGDQLDVQFSSQDGSSGQHPAVLPGVGLILWGGAGRYGEGGGTANRPPPVGVPVIEVHVSNIFARETFRRRSHIAAVAKASLCGFGINGYALAIEGLASLTAAQRPRP